MKSFITTLLLWSVLVCPPLLTADTFIPGGPVSGTWDLEGSPYLIYGDIIITSDSSLTIEPGVEVRFQAAYTLFVEGLLFALGTSSDSISFLPGNVFEWQGIQFTDAPDGSRLQYCTFERSELESGEYGGAIYALRSHPVITHCSFIQCSAFCGGAIFADSSNARIEHCYFQLNYAFRGGGIFAQYGSPIIRNCTFYDNACNPG